MKTCTKCGIPQELAAFSIDRQKKDGRCSACKSCQQGPCALYRATHTTQVRQTIRRWKLRRQVHVKHQRRARYAANKARIYAGTDAYRRAHLSWYAAYWQRWRQKHPKLVQQYQAKARRTPQARARDVESQRRREALKKGAPRVEEIDRAAIYARDAGRCHICRRPVPAKGFTLDHLTPLARGGSHTADNLAVAHRSCNSRRGTGERLPAQLRLFG